MFFGTYSHTMDDKGRVSLPSKFRARLTGEVWLVKGQEGCLWLFTQEAWDKFVGNLFAREAHDAALRRAWRWYSSGSIQVELDKAGRIRIPAEWREYAGLEKSVTVTGLNDRIELWNPERWQEYSNESDIEPLLEELFSKGLI